MASNQSNNSSYMAITGSGAIKRIRTPSTTDVLLGRGGGINNHVGNRVFRDWVRDRKDDYNLAGSKAEKTRVAKEVMELVHNQSPPGRFLQKDPSAGSSSGWWVEVDEIRALSKTSQALREGAPQIRAAHQGSTPTTRKRKNSSTRSSAKVNPSHSTPKPTAQSPLLSAITIPEVSPLPSASQTEASAPHTIPSGTQQALSELNRNLLEAKAQVSPQQHPLPNFARPLMSNQEFKKLRVDFGETPPLLPAPPQQPDVPAFSLDAPPPMPSKNENFSRAHSLALSDISAWGTDPIDWQDDFVNPFLDETEVINKTPSETLSHPAADCQKNIVRNVSSDEDREDYRQLGEMYGLSPNHNHHGGYTNAHSSFRDFNEELRSIMDAAHPEDDLTYPSKEVRGGSDNGFPTLLLPWRGGALQRRYGSSGTVKSNSNHSSHRSISIGELLNERQ